MPRPSRSSQLARQWGELGWAVPQVVALRLWRMGSAGLQPSPADQREFHRMGAEKLWAWQESWMAMTQEWWRQQQRLATMWWPMALGLGLGKGGAATAAPLQAAGDALVAMAQQGLRPVHRRAVGNAKRLGGLPLSGVASSRPRAKGASRAR